MYSNQKFQQLRFTVVRLVTVTLPGTYTEQDGKQATLQEASALPRILSPSRTMKPAMMALVVAIA